MKKLAIIGCGNIARFHIPAMQSSGFIIAAISGRPNSIDYLEGFASELKLNKTKIYNDPNDLICSDEWDAILLSCPTDVILDYLDLLAKRGKPILVEKPVSTKPKELKKFLKYKNIRVAYNRRFYKTVEYTKKFLSNNQHSIVKISIPESSYDNAKKQFPERLPKKSYENSVHMIDLLRFILGDINWVFHESVKKNNRYRALIAVGKSEMGNNIVLDSCFNSSDNFSIQVINDTKRLELKPIESLQLYDGMEVIHPTKDIPIRSYKPVLKRQLIESDAENLKPGFRSQAKDFRDFCDGKKSISATVYDSYRALQLIEDLK